MTTNTHGAGARQHGGARPKQREDDARGKHHSPKPGSGRKPKSFTLKLDDGFYVGRKTKDGKGVSPAEVWIVTEISRTHVILTDHITGDMIRLVR